MTPTDLATLDARVEALRTHQLPAYTGRMVGVSSVSTGWPHGADWRRHVEKHGLPPVVAAFALPNGCPVTVRWAREYSNSRLPVVARTIAVGGCTGFYSETRSLDITKIDGHAAVKALTPIINAAPTPSAAISAAVEHVATLCDAQAAKWAANAANLRAQVTP